MSADWREALLAGVGPTQPAVAGYRAGLLASDNPLCRIGWSTLAGIVGDQVVRVPAARMVKAGVLVEQARYTMADRAGSPAGAEVLDPVLVGRLLDRGCSLVLQDLQKYCDVVRVQARWLGSRIRQPLFVNAFASPPDAGALAVHSDPYSAWLVQTLGSKRWRVWRPDREPERDPPDLAVTLSPGDVLWLPRRWKHHGISGPGSSIHLTFAIRPPDDSADPATSDAGLSTPDAARAHRHRFVPLPARWATAEPAPGPATELHAHPDGVVLSAEQDAGDLLVITADDEVVVPAAARSAFQALLVPGGRADYAAAEKALGEATVAALLRSRLLCDQRVPLECRLAGSP
jgi:hypothetical protein